MGLGASVSALSVAVLLSGFSGIQDVDATAGRASDPLDVILQFDALRLDGVRAALDSSGFPILYEYQATPAFHVQAPPSAVDELASIPGVSHVEIVQPALPMLATSKTAIRSHLVTDPLGGLRDRLGRPIDGRGIGVAVVDTGIDGTHPDLKYRVPVSAGILGTDFAVAENLLIVSTSYRYGLFPMPNTDVTDGHGTHVAGTIAGRGKVDPTMRGVAPGAVLYGLATGNLNLLLWTSQAFDWIATHHDTVDPPIRVVSNSWALFGEIDSNSMLATLTKQLIDAGVVVVWAAGNNGGDGSTMETNSLCQIPREGVICVAAYDDLNTGTRDGRVWEWTSRGQTNNPATWPDLSAPGVKIRATAPLFSLDTLLAPPTAPYAELSGTSMSTPHVSGVVALMLQANPALTPAQVESILESTAYKFSDGGPYVSSSDPRFDGSHSAKGHGIVDAYAAVQRGMAT